MLVVTRVLQVDYLFPARERSALFALLSGAIVIINYDCAAAIDFFTNVKSAFHRVVRAPHARDKHLKRAAAIEISNNIANDSPLKRVEGTDDRFAHRRNPGEIVSFDVIFELVSDWRAIRRGSSQRGVEKTYENRIKASLSLSRPESESSTSRFSGRLRASRKKRFTMGLLSQ